MDRYAAQDESELNIVREILRFIYSEHRPEKIADVDALMEEWSGEERLLLAKVKNKYARAAAAKAKQKRYEAAAEQYFDDTSAARSALS